MFTDPATGQKASRLVYLSDEETLAYQLHIRGGKLMITNAHGTLEPFDCSGQEYKDRSRTKNGERTPQANTAYSGMENNGGKGVAGFAMGVNRSIYASRHWNHAAAKGSFYHSSYFGGSKVLCTGCMTVIDGHLTYINNDSGHYGPSVGQMSLALQALQAQGVDITNVTVDILKNKAFVKMKATSLLKADDQKGMNFNIVSKDSLPAITAIAGRVRAALTDYEARFKGFKGIFTSQTKTSRDALEILKGIRDDETLVKEVQFLLYSFVRDYWPDVRPIASPLGTPPTQRFPRHGTGDLRDRLVAAIEPLLGPETKRNP